MYCAPEQGRVDLRRWLVGELLQVKRVEDQLPFGVVEPAPVWRAHDDIVVGNRGFWFGLTRSIQRRTAHGQRVTRRIYFGNYFFEC